MPVSVRRSPFGSGDKPKPKVATISREQVVPVPRNTTDLRTPQARVLAALVPISPDDPVFDWPTYRRDVLAAKAGYTAISGSITRALNGIREGSSSGDAHLGLLALKYVEELEFELDGGIKETNYRITPAGIAAFRAYELAVGKLPPLRDKETCTNDRYKKEKGQKQ